MHRSAFKQRVRSAGSHGFTMVELLAAIAIIVILSGLGIGAARYASHRADQSRARSDMERIAQALEQYRVEYGAYPGNNATTWGNSDMAEDGEWVEPFDPESYEGAKQEFMEQLMSDLPKTDPWGGAAGQSYQYRRLSRFSFQLRSLGPDGRAGTEDDIVWPF